MAPILFPLFLFGWLPHKKMVLPKNGPTKNGPSPTNCSLKNGPSPKKGQPFFFPGSLNNRGTPISGVHSLVPSHHTHGSEPADRMSRPGARQATSASTTSPSACSMARGLKGLWLIARGFSNCDTSWNPQSFSLGSISFLYHRSGFHSPQTCLKPAASWIFSELVPRGWFFPGSQFRDVAVGQTDGAILG